MLHTVHGHSTFFFFLHAVLHICVFEVHDMARPNAPSRHRLSIVGRVECRDVCASAMYSKNGDVFISELWFVITSSMVERKTEMGI